MSINNMTIKKQITKGCPQGSCCGPGFWNVLYNPLLELEFANQTKVIAFADDLILLTKGESIREVENYSNI